MTLLLGILFLVSGTAGAQDCPAGYNKTTCDALVKQREAAFEAARADPRVVRLEQQMDDALRVYGRPDTDAGMRDTALDSFNDAKHQLKVIAGPGRDPKDEGIRQITQKMSDRLDGMMSEPAPAGLEAEKDSGKKTVKDDKGEPIKPQTPAEQARDAGLPDKQAKEAAQFLETPPGLPSAGPDGGSAVDQDQKTEEQARAMPPSERQFAAQFLANRGMALEQSHSEEETQYRDIGARFNALGRPQDALKSLDRAVGLNKNDAEALGQRARARASLGDGDGALVDARKALKLDPHNLLAQIIVGHADSLSQSARRIGGQKLDFGAALLAAGAGRSSKSTSGSGPQDSGDLPLAVSQPGDYERAAAELTPAQAFSPLVQKAEQSRRMGDKSTALFLLSQAVDATPADAAAWTVRSEVKIDYKNFPGAVSDAKRALDLHPSVALSARALRAKAYAEIEQGDFGSALTDLALAIQLEPDNGLSLFYRAMAEEKLGRTADALRDYDKSDDLDPSLTPLTTEAFQRLGALPGQTRGVRLSALWAKVKPRQWMRGGSLALGAGLLFVGLLGAAAAKRMTARGARSSAPSESEAPTGLDPTPVSISAGTVLGKNYRVTGELGRGGMGVVYDAFDDTLQRRVAIKQLQRDESTTSEDLDRFLKEARLVAQLKHPNLAEIYTVINEGDLFLVFEYVDGEALDRVLRLNGRRPIEQARRILSDVAGALAYAHERKIIHRDLKPSNIMISKDGSAKIMDFGIAHQSSGASAMTRTSASGTPPYMAPEQTMGSVSKASDLYALAVMAYELLTGERPFSGPDFLEQKLRKVYIPPSQRDPNLRRDLDAFFASAFDPDPTKRPENAKDFLRRFEGASAALP